MISILAIVSVIIMRDSAKDIVLTVVSAIGGNGNGKNACKK